MPNITAVGTYTGSTAGFEFLRPKGERPTILLFAGSALPTTLTVNYIDDQGTTRVFEDGTITALPKTVYFRRGLQRPISIVVTGGSPNFNVSEG